MTTRESTTRPSDVPPADVCLIPGCTRTEYRAGHCARHYDDRTRICAAPACDRPTKSRGYCNAHYLQIYHKGFRVPVKPRHKSTRRDADARLTTMFAQQVIALVDDSECMSTMAPPVRIQWYEGCIRAFDAETEQAGLYDQLTVLIEHPELVLAEVRVLREKLERP